MLHDYQGYSYDTCALGAVRYSRARSLQLVLDSVRSKVPRDVHSRLQRVQLFGCVWRYGYTGIDDAVQLSGSSVVPDLDAVEESLRTVERVSIEAYPWPTSLVECHPHMYVCALSLLFNSSYYYHMYYTYLVCVHSSHSHFDVIWSIFFRSRGNLFG